MTPENPELLVLFLTDMEASSRLWQSHPREMPAVLDVVDALVQRVVTMHGGMLVKARGEGDSHFVVFKLASSAARAAAHMQQALTSTPWPAGIEPRLRIALHAGEVQRRGDEYSGIAVNRAARLRSVAHGGQVVASRAVTEFVADDLGDGVRFVSLGLHRVRDLPGWTEIFQLCSPSLMREFPALVTLDTGLPPVSTVVFLDAVGTARAAGRMTPDDERALWSMFVDLFAGSFAAANGQYLQHLGDGCLALFADPVGAVAFAREARFGASSLDLELRAAIHIGRVEFTSGVPFGRTLRVAGAFLRQAVPGKITLSSAAARLVDPADDIVLIAE